MTQNGSILRTLMSLVVW